jgi:hypothetical protein
MTTRKVHALRLSGLDGCEAVQAVRSLLSDRSKADLSSLIVLDDTATLLDHTTAFEHLLTSGRLNHLLCVAIGPPARNDRTVTLPGSISSGQGSVVLWVSDPIGVDWRLEASAPATARPDAKLSGLHHLVEVLSAAEIFDEVRDLVLALPGGVASPGLRLDEASDMVSGFPFALAAAIGRLTESQATTASRVDQVEVLISRLADQLAGTAELDQNGQLAQARARCEAEAETAVTALDELAGLGGLFGAGQPGVRAREQVVATGEALRDFKKMASDLFDYAHAHGGLSEQQRQRVHDMGLRLADRRVAEPHDPLSPGSAPPSDVVTKAAIDAVHAGDRLPTVAERLVIAERRLTPRGSRVYLDDLDACCPPFLAERLLNPKPPPGSQRWVPLAGAIASALGALGGKAGIATGVAVALLWTGIVALSTGTRSGGNPTRMRTAMEVNLAGALAGAAVGVAIGFALSPPVFVSAIGLTLAIVIVLVAGARSWHGRVLAWKHDLWPQQAADAADAAADLVVKVGASEWSADAAILDAIARTKVTVTGIVDQLREYAVQVQTSSAEARRWQNARLSSSFEPTLRDLVISVLAAQPARGYPDGQEAYRNVMARTEDLIRQWNAIAVERGPFARPPFATASERDDAYIEPDDLGAIATAASYDPDDVMWQLCAPADLAMLDTHGRKAVVAFAPRMMRQALIRLLPSDTVWTSSGQYAGLLRLVPLRPGRVILDWSANSEQETAE